MCYVGRVTVYFPGTGLNGLHVGQLTSSSYLANFQRTAESPGHSQQEIAAMSTGS
jgi:hypothetical protein